MEKFYQMSLHLLHHKREERLGLADYEPDFSIRPEQVDYVNCTKYLDAFALLYNLDIGRLQNEDIYSVLPDEWFMELCIDSDIILYDMHLVNVPREMDLPYIDEKRAKEGDVIGTARMIQNGAMYECDVVIAYSPYNKSLRENINLASTRFIPYEEGIDDWRERFEFNYYDDHHVYMKDKLTTYTYDIPEEEIRLMLWNKMNFEQMKEYLLKHMEDWLKVNHELSADEEITNFFASKAFTDIDIFE